MARLTTVTFAVALAGGALILPLAPASATSLSAAAGLIASQADAFSPLIEAQFRRRAYRRGVGAAVGAGIAAGVIGEMIEMEADRAASAQEDAITYCMRRFRSYDPETQTYVGKGGRRYRCP